MSLLHVAAMPFPSVQGTQAAVRSMLEAEHAADRSPELLTYAHGGYELLVPWPVHRIADVVRDRSLRSGPSLRKIFEDAQLAVAARKLVREKQPTAVIAHHVEAASAAMAARAHPLVFVAHTALGPELPSYLPDRARKIAERAGDAFDVALARRADATVAIAPSLCERLSRSADREIAYVPVPWPVPPAIDPAERAKARARFGLGALDPVLLYAGNLDAYQGLTVLAEAFGHVRARKPDAQLIVATAADDVSPIERALWSAGCRDAVRFAPLADEPDRRIVHAAADAVCIPRGFEGGLPIKLLDALSRGVPTIAARRATAGLALDGAVVIARDDDAEALAAAALLTLEGRESAAQLGRRGTEYIKRAHAPERYLEAMDTAVRAARG